MTGCVRDEEIGLPHDVPLFKKPFRPQEPLDAVRRATAPPTQVPASDSVGELHRNVCNARDKWFASMNNMGEIIAEIPSGLPRPDGSARIELSGRERSAAFARYQKALGEYERALKEEQSPGRGPESPCPQKA